MPQWRTRCPGLPQLPARWRSFSPWERSLVLLNRPPTLPRAVAAGLLLALGLLTREVVIVAPAVVVVVAWARPGGELKHSLLRSLPLWIVDIGGVVLRASPERA